MRRIVGRVAFSLGVAVFIAGGWDPGDVRERLTAVAIFFAIAMLATSEADGLFDRRRS
jgi:hypothetical protein